MSAALEKYLAAREAYNLARCALAEAESGLVSQLWMRDDGAKTHKLDGYKVTITGRINRTIDPEKLQELDLPPGMVPVKYRPEIDMGKMRSLRENHPIDYLKFSACMIATPGKPSVSVKKLED